MSALHPCWHLSMRSLWLGSGGLLRAGVLCSVSCSDATLCLGMALRV